MARGRPTDYTEELANKICEQIAIGRSLNGVCKQDWAPSYPTVMRWIQKYEDFRNNYARARDESADTLADEIVEIADTDPDPARARVRVDARKWVAAKLKPKKYGDKIDVSGDLKVDVDASAVLERLEAALSRALDSI